jgi:uncharacterized protein YbjT (DUF2867 family)
MDMSGIVLVTGAAGGQQGSTGRLVTELLLQRGERVRAYVHTEDERSERLRAIGAEVVAGDLRDIAQVEPALEDVDRVFFTYPVADGLLDATAAVAAAARAHGVGRLVEVSQLTPKPHEHSPRTRQHWVSEQVFDWAEVGAVHLRATVFYENFLRMAVGAAAAGGDFALPLGPADNTIPLVSATDVARIGAALLADPLTPASPHYLLVGAVPTVADLVAALGTALGVELRYVNIDERTWRDYARAAGTNQHAVEHLSRLWQRFSKAEYRSQADYRVTDSVERVTGTPAQTLAEFLQSHRETVLSGTPD